jgi:hypothetical protein
VAKFEDKMVRDVVTADCFRADHLLEGSLPFLQLLYFGNFRSLDKIDELLKEPGLSEQRILELKTVAARADDYSVEVPSSLFSSSCFLKIIVGTRCPASAVQGQSA